jgi:hypothetical protein
MEALKTWLSSQVTDFFDTGIQNVFSDITSASIPAVTTLRCSLSMYVVFVYNIFFLISYFLNSSPKVTSKQPSYPHLLFV